MTRRRPGRVLWCLAVGLALSACGNPYMSWRSAWSGRLSDATVVRHSSGGRLDVRHARLITGNDDAFLSKLEMVQAARSTIDATYYIYTEDYSSSVLTEALIAAARRGVRVRLLVDYFTNYKHLDLFTMMERRGSDGRGRLEVRLYGRPTRNIVMDAAYATLGCGDPTGSAAAVCTAARLAEVERAFAEERIDGRLAAELGISNLAVGGSGLFLSGLYTRRPDVAGLAVARGPALAPPGGPGAPPALALDSEGLGRLARHAWQTRTDPSLRALQGQVLLATLLPARAEGGSPVQRALAPHLPAPRRSQAEVLRDWEYLTDFTHHKLLLVDRTHVQLGGRNIEDSYHMRKNPLLDKYIFVDTDLRAELRGGGAGIEAAFGALWDFRRMVATTAEVRQHAPNDFVANREAFDAAATACAAAGDAAAVEACVGREFRNRARALSDRETVRHERMQANARRYRRDYRFAAEPDPWPTFTIDPGAFVAYIENLPFQGGPKDPPTRRAYGAVNDAEALHGKRIHSLWVAGLENVCRVATAAAPQRVLLHNAYFFPSSNLVRAFRRMVSGELDCRHVTVTVLTNSIETTDLNVVNLLARQAAKAFAEFYQARRDPTRGARFEYFEYERFDPTHPISLHSKVSVLGGDVIVGSANADVRSYMMDSNNGFFVRDAPAFVGRYLVYLDDWLRDPARTRSLTERLARTPRAELTAADVGEFRKLLAGPLQQGWIDPTQARLAEGLLVEVLDLVYDLTRAILAGGDEGRRAEQRFDRLFKPI